MQVKEGIFLALLVATLLLVASYTTTLVKSSSKQQQQQQIVSLFPSKAGDADTASSPEGSKV